MKRVLILQNLVPHYRKSLYNALALHYEVTVLHSGMPSVVAGDAYREKITRVRKFGPFFLQSGVLTEVHKDYDAIIAMFDVRWLMNAAAMWTHSRRAAFIWWGVWFGKSGIANTMKRFLSARGRPIIFYDRQERERFKSAGLPPRLLYVAHNTFHVADREPSFDHDPKDSILFVGTLDPRKQNDVLVRAFHRSIPRIPPGIRLVFVGSGQEEAGLKSLVTELEIDDRVVFPGRINDPSGLKEWYMRALFSVSFGQAGLSVLQSLAFGVPFLTKENAISGGEKNNIKDGYNGVLCGDSVDALEKALVGLCADSGNTRKLGRNAYEYYSENCTMEKMVEGFRAALEGQEPS